MTRTYNPPSRVILVCIYQTAELDITNELLAYSFSFFGPILKILIFEKGPTTKAFVQFLQLKHAQYALFLTDSGYIPGMVLRNNIFFVKFNSIESSKVHGNRNQIWLNPQYFVSPPPFNPYKNLVDYNNINKVCVDNLNLSPIKLQDQIAMLASLQLQQYIEYEIEPDVYQIDEIGILIQKSINDLLKQNDNKAVRKDSQDTNNSLQEQKQFQLQNKNSFRGLIQYNNLNIPTIINQI